MEIYNLGSAKSKKFKLSLNSVENFKRGDFLAIDFTDNILKFAITPYGPNVNSSINLTLGKTDPNTAQYLLDCIHSIKARATIFLFVIERVDGNNLEVQSYCFNTMNEFHTPIDIEVDESIADRIPEFEKRYIWKGYGNPVVFVLNNKIGKRQSADLAFVSGHSLLKAKTLGKACVAYKEQPFRNNELLLDFNTAPEIRFVKRTEVSNNDFLENLDQISNGASYINRWNAYSELSKKALEQESEEFGSVRYDSCNINNGMDGITFEFKINERLDNSYVGRDLCVAAEKNISVGTIKRIQSDIVTTFLDSEDFWNDIPAKGELELNSIGDKIIAMRREKAKQRILSGQAPIKSIVSIVENGASSHLEWSTHKPVTNKLKRNFKKADILNDCQVKAIELAINTPDIAVIQGPPGTGKTTVIKGICERFREIFEDEERRKQKLNPEYITHSPKILITSFQNEAVDNAISAPLQGDLPAYRKVSRRAKGNVKIQYQKALESWLDGVRTFISTDTKNTNAQVMNEKRQVMEDNFLKYKNAESQEDSLKLAAELLNSYLSFINIKYDEQLINKAKIIIRNIQTRFSEKSIDIPSEDPLVKRLEMQRLDLSSFADDGTINAKRLKATLKLRSEELNIQPDDFKLLDAICNGEFTDKEFQRYINFVNSLKKLYCKEPIQIDINDQKVIDECLLSMSYCFNEQYMNLFPDNESRKALILDEFMNRLEQEYESVVKKYSMTTAATCQNSLDLHDINDRTFDLVVVDEAARANPLDLFIPLSMGKKIVLVGDHKQLPHMLEPDVVNRIKEDPKFKNLSALEQSLFERLYEMFGKESRPRTVMLEEQFRMHPDICNFVSKQFYEGKLKMSSAANLENYKSHPEINGGRALAFINISNAEGPEKTGQSLSRNVEAKKICDDVTKILQKVPDATIGIISFYSAQVSLINENLNEKVNNEQKAQIDVGTVDAFQGKEYDYVLLSCVRSFKDNGPHKHNLDFINKPNRLCVAFSRSKKQLAVYGDAECLKPIESINELYRICHEQNGGYYYAY